MRMTAVMRPLAVLAIVFLTHALPARCEAGSPEVNRLQPSGGQRGTDVSLTFRGSRLKDAQEVISHWPGITFKNLEVVGDGEIKVLATLAADCRLGEHALRVRTASGMSDLKTFYVGPFGTVGEVEPNNEFEAPQAISLGVTISGTIKAEDADYFVVQAKKGQRLTAEVEGIRLGRDMFDPCVTILDSKRFELALSDDNALVRQDSIASVLAPEDDNYLIQVRHT